MLKHLPMNFIERICELLKVSLALCYVPNIWIQSEMIFIPKPGKPDYSDPRAFRPITLQSFIYKAQERVALWQLQDNYFRRKPFHQAQHAFRMGRSCDSAIAETVDCLESSIARNEYALALFIDIKGAFDNLDQSQAILAMKGRGAPKWFVNFYEAYLKDRTAKCTLFGNSETRTIPHGSPQGGVFSPSFWNLAFDEILDIINDGTFRGIGFADDANIIIRGVDLPTLFSLMQAKIAEIMQWSQKFGLTFCPKKTVAVLFTHKRPKKIPTLKMLGQNIPMSKTVKYLGVILDSRLSFRAHIVSKIKEAKGVLMRTRNRLTTTRGPSPKNTRWIHKCVALPVFTYACHVWWHKAKESELRKLNRLGCLLIAPVLHNTPTASLELIYNLPPLELVLRKEAGAKFLNILGTFKRVWQGLDKNQQKFGFYQECQNLITAAGITCTDMDTKKDIMLNRKFEVSTSRILESDNEDISFYTDGSKMDTGVGYGLTSVGDIEYEEKGSLRDDATVFQAEVMAIKSVAKYLIREKISEKRITIYSDSMAAILAMRAMKLTSRLVSEAKFLMNFAAEENTIKIRWIKAHVGHEGNERADTLAKEGIEGERRQVRLNKAHVKQLLHAKMLREWDQKWTSSNEYKETKHWLVSVYAPQRGQGISLKRQDLGKCVQFITGFCNLNYHSHRKCMAIDKACRLCEEDEERPIHLALTCPRVHMTSRLFLNAFLLNRNEWDFNKLNSFLQQSPLDQLMATRTVLNAEGIQTQSSLT